MLNIWSINLKYLLLLLFTYSFSTVSFANHFSSGASHNGPDRQADQKGYMESRETGVNEKEVKINLSEPINSSDSDNESNS